MIGDAQSMEIFRDIFCSAWYRQRNPDVAAAGIDPIEHYLAYGWREGRDPSPLFDTSWYASQIRDIDLRVDPLTHYIRTGAEAGLDPHPLFKGKWYARQVGGMPSGNPLAHYLRSEGGRFHDPHPLFHARWYLANNPDVVQADVNPFLHYLADGETEGRNPNPLFDVTWYARASSAPRVPGSSYLAHYVTRGSIAGIDPHPIFDHRWYTSQLHHRLPGDQSALEHYLIEGAENRLSPHPLFDADWYLRSYPEVETAGVNPLVHYVEEGNGYGTEPHPLFKGNWYRFHYGNFEEIFPNPLSHFLRYGSSKGYDPSPDFSTLWYRDRYHEEDWDLINPFTHYLALGLKEGYIPLPLQVCYKNLLHRIDQNSASTALERGRHVRLMIDPPEFMIFVCGSDGEAYDRTLSSIKRQTYPHVSIWRSSGVGAVRAARSKKNVYFMWLQPGDVLKGTALYHFASAAAQDPSIDMIYTDEEVVDGSEQRVLPFYKPAWSPDLLLSFDYIGRAACYKLSILDVDALAASSSFAFLLATLKSVDRIIHLREITMRCPDRRFGTDAEIATDAEALTRYCRRFGGDIAVSVRSDRSRSYALTYRGASRPSVSVIIYREGRGGDPRPERTAPDARADPGRLIDYEPLEILELDGPDIDGEDHTAFAPPGIGGDPRGDRVLARRLNAAVERAGGEHVLFLDAAFQPVGPGFLPRLVSHFVKPFVGAVSPRIARSRGTAFRLGQILSRGVLQDIRCDPCHGAKDYFFSCTAARNVRAAGLNGLLTRRSVFIARGGFDPEVCDALMAADYCLDLIQRDLTIVCEPSGEIRAADGSHTDGDNYQQCDVGQDPVFSRKWAPELILDPYYNDFYLATCPAAFDGRHS